MKAIVLARDGAPIDADESKTQVWQATPLDIVPEYSLRLSVWALQSIMANSRCHASRMTAKGALDMLGFTEDLPTDGKGNLKPVKYPGNPERVGGIWTFG